MRQSHLNSLAGLGAIILLALVAPEPAAAKIVCQGNFQMNKSGPIATPYCMERQIALVAQSYGWKVTQAEIADKPLTKVRICQVLGGDVRLKGSCAGYGPENYAPAR